MKVLLESKKLIIYKNFGVNYTHKVFLNYDSWITVPDILINTKKNRAKIRNIKLML